MGYNAPICSERLNYVSSLVMELSKYDPKVRVFAPGESVYSGSSRYPEMDLQPDFYQCAWSDT